MFDVLLYVAGVSKPNADATTYAVNVRIHKNDENKNTVTELQLSVAEVDVAPWKAALGTYPNHHSFTF